MLNAILSLFAFTGCTKDKEVQKDDVLSIPKTPYGGNQLKIDGYYYQLFEGKIHNIILFYRNGLITEYGGSRSDFNDAAIYINEGTNKVKNIKYAWGVYAINGLEIKIEKWYPINPGQPLKSFVRSGRIINDTTYQLTEMYRFQNGEITEHSQINETYYYRHFAPKPDSTNTFIP